MTELSIKQLIDEAIQKRRLSIENLDRILSDDAGYDANVSRLNTHLDDDLIIEIPASRYLEGGKHLVDSVSNGSNNPSKNQRPPEQAPLPEFTENGSWQSARMTREEEQRLAKRLEFFKHRLVKVVENADLSPRDRLDYLRDISCKIKSESKEQPGACLLCEKLGACPKKKGGVVFHTCRAFNRCRSQFVERNLHIVRFIAQTYRTYGVPLADLVQEGNAALIRAVEKFDWRKQVRLQTYAEFWIRQALERLINANKWIVRVPTYMQQRIRRIRREGKLPGSGARITTQEVSEAIDTNPTVARHLMETEKGHLSLDSLVSNGEQVKPADLIADQRSDFILPEEVEYRAKRMQEALDLLNDQERTIIHHRFEINGFEKKTLSQLGKMLNISRERVRQIEARTLDKLKKPMMLGSLKYYI